MTTCRTNPEAQLFAHGRPNVSPKDAARALGITDQQVQDLLKAGVFVACQVNDSGEPVRILRYTLEAWRLERFLEANGFECQVTSTPEITWWRSELRKKTAVGGGL